MAKYDTTQGSERIIAILTACEIYDKIKKDNSIYIAGSLPAYCIAPITASCDFINSTNLENKKQRMPNDIDIYTTNYSKSRNTFSSLRNWMFDFANSTVITYCAKDAEKKYPITNLQFITNSVSNNLNEVFDSYDCGLTCVAYHPFSNTFIVHPRFMDELNNNCFKITINTYISIQKINSVINRIIKSKYRSRQWFDCQCVIASKDCIFSVDAYLSSNHNVVVISSNKPPLPYVIAFNKKHYCLCCDMINDFQICKSCLKCTTQKICEFIEKNELIKNKNIQIYVNQSNFIDVLSFYFTDYHNATVKQQCIKCDDKNFEFIDVDELIDVDIIIFTILREKNDQLNTDYASYLLLFEKFANLRGIQQNENITKQPITIIFITERFQTDSPFDGRMHAINEKLQNIQVTLIEFKINKTYLINDFTTTAQRLIARCISYVISNAEKYNCQCVNFSETIKMINKNSTIDKNTSIQHTPRNNECYIDKNSIPESLLGAEIIQNSLCNEEDPEPILVPFSRDELWIPFNKRITDIETFKIIFNICDYFMVDCKYLLTFAYKHKNRYGEMIKLFAKEKGMCAMANVILSFYEFLDGTLDIKKLNNAPLLTFICEQSDHFITTYMKQYSGYEVFLSDDNFKIVFQNEHLKNLASNWLNVDKPHIYFSKEWAYSGSLKINHFNKYVNDNVVTEENIVDVFVCSNNVHYKYAKMFPILYENYNILVDENATLQEIEHIESIVKPPNNVHYFNENRGKSYSLEIFKHIINKLTPQYSHKQILGMAIMSQSAENLNYLLEFL